MFRKICSKLHLWIGLFTSPVVIVVCLSGALLVFEDEIRSCLEPYHFIEVRDTSFLSPSELETAARETAGAAGAALQSRIDYRGTGMSAVVMLFGGGSLYNVYVDPYSGNVLKVSDQTRDFFRIVKSGHRTLWLGPAGKMIVGISVSLFAVALLSGIVLWFPRRFNRKALRNRLTVQWKAPKAKKTYDLHNVLGFYAALGVLILALTGLAITFPGFRNFVYGVVSATGSRPPVAHSVRSDTTARDSLCLMHPEDAIAARLLAEYPAGRNTGLSVFPPATAEAPVWVIVNPRTDNTIQGTETRYCREFRYFDRYTLQELYNGGLENIPVAEASGAAKLLRMNYDLHTGRIGSVYTKIIAFVCSLIGASLPVTGYLIWKRRRRRK